MSTVLQFPIQGRMEGRPTTVDSLLAFGTVWPQIRPTIRWCAKELTTNVDHQEVLMQEAMLALWNIDPIRYDFRDRRDVRHLRATLLHYITVHWDDEGGRFQAKVPPLKLDQFPSRRIKSRRATPRAES